MVSNRDVQACIVQLVAMGFDIPIDNRDGHDTYLECNKDEELTANWLWEQWLEFEDLTLRIVNIGCSVVDIRWLKCEYQVLLFL